MATSSEDALGELYAWDSTIDEMYERGVDHADFDEDDALEAYEEMIQVGASAIGEAADAVVSLAAQLLTKHFAKFPHVHLNVVDVLLALCALDRPQAVRIHSVRSLLQIVKSGASATPPLVALCRDRIAAGVVSLLTKEPSDNKKNVVLRLLTQLQETLVTVDGEMKKMEKKEKRKEKKKEDKNKAKQKEEEKKDKDETDRKATEEEYRRREERRREEDAKRERREARFRLETAKTTDSPRGSDAKPRNVEQRVETPEPKRQDRSREDHQDRDHKSRADRQDRDNRDRDRDRAARPAQNDRKMDTAPRDEQPTRERRLSTGKENGNGCPPSSFIFVGSVPRHTYHDDIINYLSCIDESITHSCVQIKYPTPHAGGYAFVSLESVDHARQAIRHIKTTEFNGRKLIGDFARGPPCATLQFVERNGSSTSMHAANAVSHVDETTLGKSIWDELCKALEKYGSMDVVRDGRVRFRDAESAKSVIRQHHFRIGGRELLPVYDPQEQAEIDSSKRRRRRSEDDDEGARRGDGAGADGRTQPSRSDDRRGARDDGDRKRRRSPSFDLDMQKDKQPRRDDNNDKNARHNRGRREFNQSRYGPQEPPSSPPSKRRSGSFGEYEVSIRRDRPASRERESSVDNRGREAHRRHRSSSRSPNPDDKHMSTSSRAGSSHRGRSRSRSRTRSPVKRFAEGRSGMKIPPGPRRSRSPARSTTSSKHGRGGYEDEHRVRRDSSFAHRDDAPDGLGRGNRERARSPPSRRHDSSIRGGLQQKNAPDVRRSRSPLKGKEFADDRRRKDCGDRYGEQGQPAPRGRSHSPRGQSRSPQRTPPSGRSGNGERRGGGEDSNGDARLRQDRERSRPRDDTRASDRPDLSRRGSDERAIDGERRREEPRSPRFGDSDHHEQRNGRANGPPKMSKYGTVTGRARSPSPPRFRRDETSTNRRGRDDRDQGDQRGRPVERGLERYGNGNRSRENGDRRSSPPRQHADDHGSDKRQSAARQRSPSPKHTGRRRSRSPSPFSPNSHKKQRSRSPRSSAEAGRNRNRDHRPSRGDADGRRQIGEHDRRGNHNDKADGRGRYGSKQDNDRARENRRGRDREPSPRNADDKRNAERRQRSPRPQSPRVQHVRTPSPVAFDNNSSADDVKRPQQKESPRAALKGASSAAYEDIDECMVDYEEDDD